MTRYVIVRRSDGWGWLGENHWISDPTKATTFDDSEDASTAGLLGCPLASEDWAIVPIELPDPVEGHPV
jgi:hypothetical protein